jgi:hypothetical protein
MPNRRNCILLVSLMALQPDVKDRCPVKNMLTLPVVSSAHCLVADGLNWTTTTIDSINYGAEVIHTDKAVEAGREAPSNRRCASAYLPTHHHARPSVSHKLLIRPPTPIAWCTSLWPGRAVFQMGSTGMVSTLRAASTW